MVKHWARYAIVRIEHEEQCPDDPPHLFRHLVRFHPVHSGFDLRKALVTFCVDEVGLRSFEMGSETTGRPKLGAEFPNDGISQPFATEASIGECERRPIRCSGPATVDLDQHRKVRCDLSI
jgi:hypothetical protein